MRSILLLSVAVRLLLASGDQQSQATEQINREHKAKHVAVIRDIYIAKPNLIVRGTNLSKVEVWCIPTGTGITEQNFGLLGTAKRITAVGRRERWVLPIPVVSTYPHDLGCVEIFAKGFDAKGDVVGRKSLRFVGVTDLNQALYGSFKNRQ